jgi:ArsR family transcriptional regulator, lead/cadmium/zinc/bismuth-responsive transcriptional repressor
MAPRPPLSVQEAAQLFGLLAEPTRLRILLALRDKEEVSVGDLTAVAGLSRQATAYHLTLLRRWDVVECRQAGQQVFYRVASARVAEVLKAVGGE